MNSSNNQDNIIISWLLWHFYEMPRFLFSVWKNYLLFGLDFFSVPLLFLTLFSPWRKYRWNYPKGFSITEYLNTFISNIFSRIVGAVCRLVLIILGIIVQIFIFLAGIIVISFWILIPFMLIALILFLIYGI